MGKIKKKSNLSITVSCIIISVLGRGSIKVISRRLIWRWEDAAITDFFQIRASNHGRIRAKKDTGAKERALNAITDELVYTACCRLVNYYNCEVPAIFRLALVHQRYIPIPTCRHCPAILNSTNSYKINHIVHKNWTLNVVWVSHIALILTFKFVK